MQINLPRGRVLVIAAAGVLLLIVELLPATPGFDVDLSALILSLVLGATALVTVGLERIGSDRLLGLAGPLRRLAGNTLIALAALAVALLGGEYATRWLLRDVTTTPDFRGYFSARWLKGVRHNHYGFRDREFTEGKPPGVFRIAVVGDSFTYGNGIPVDSRFSNVIQGSLPGSVEVLNFGAPGANTPEEVLLVQTKILRLEPDFVLVQWFVNDVEGDEANGRPSVGPLLPFRALHAWLYSSSALYTVLNVQWTRWEVYRYMGGTYEDYMQGRFADPQGGSAVEAAGAMHRLISVSRSRGADVGIVLFPASAYDLGAGYPFQYLHDRILELCAEENVTCVDLRADFAAVKDRRRLWASALDPHPSVQANRIAALRILQAFDARWLARPPSS